MTMFSVVVTVYNVEEEWMRACLESVRGQSDGDFEVILVDDGSTDGSGRICDEYADMDRRFRVIHKDNGGLSSARNRGMEAAKGQWILFVDNDDLLTEDAISVLRRALAGKECDMAYFDTVRRGLGEERRYHTLQARDGEILEGERVYALLLDMVAVGYETRHVPHGFVTAWGKAYRRGYLQEKGITFYEGIRVGEDFPFNAECLAARGRVMYIEKALYIRNLRSGSLVHMYYPQVLDNERKLMGYMTGRLAGERGDERMEKALIKRCTENLFSMAEYDMGHPDNPGSVWEGARALRRMAREEPYKSAVRMCPLRWLRGKRERLGIALIRLGMEEACVTIMRLAARYKRKRGTAL